MTQPLRRIVLAQVQGAQPSQQDLVHPLHQPAYPGRVRRHDVKLDAPRLTELPHLRIVKLRAAICHKCFRFRVSVAHLRKRSAC